MALLGVSFQQPKLLGFSRQFVNGVVEELRLLGVGLLELGLVGLFELDGAAELICNR